MRAITDKHRVNDPIHMIQELSPDTFSIWITAGYGEEYRFLATGLKGNPDRVNETKAWRHVPQARTRFSFVSTGARLCSGNLTNTPSKLVVSAPRFRSTKKNHKKNRRLLTRIRVGYRFPDRLGPPNNQKYGNSSRTNYKENTAFTPLFRDNEVSCRQRARSPCQYALTCPNTRLRVGPWWQYALAVLDRQAAKGYTVPIRADSALLLALLGFGSAYVCVPSFDTARRVWIVLGFQTRVYAGTLKYRSGVVCVKMGAPVECRRYQGVRVERYKRSPSVRPVGVWLAKTARTMGASFLDLKIEQMMSINASN
ncbi:hypothetical protein AG1IA_03504 [Rhizoctonia solani AG-1 IA]|uniref:Uncharacterized protein n=1 Tax=Thanatephorus cucumeris (strain AG1-IA) TaxID=983506 RepID=L8X1I9_THACA|nr:hypothetical protein AG1IA_03504 [Rhizoctonia solani AG-1 IA]